MTTPTLPLSTAEPGWRNLYRIGAAAALFQLAAIVAYAVATALLGPKPEGAAEFFAIQQRSPLEAVLRGDFLLLFLIGGYLGTFPALGMALRRVSPVGALYATLFTLIAVTGIFVLESTFSLLHLGDQYAKASDPVQRAGLIAAGEAVIASDMWNSTGAYLGGILLQGGGVIISLVMLRSRDFSRVTAISGLLANGLDLAQHVLHPFTPGFSSVLQMLMGPFYIVWFLMLARDLWRLARREPAAQTGRIPAQ